MEGLDKMEETFDKLENEYSQFKKYLIGRY
jgi:hypothetical protein